MPPVSGSSYDKNFQQQLLAHLRWEDELLKSAVRVLVVDDFEIPVMRITYEALRNYYNKYRRIPAEQELDDELVSIINNVSGSAETGINPEEYEALAQLRYYIAVMADERQRNLERFRNELGLYISWIRSTKVLGALVPAIYRGAGAESLETKLSNIRLEVTSKLDSESSQKSFSENSGIMMTDEEIEFRVPTGSPKLDSMIDGGLGLGELGMVTACPGMGKTTTLINFGVGANLVRQHHLLISLELPASLINRRYAAIAGCIPGTYVKKVIHLWTPEYRKRFHMIMDEKFAAHDFFTVSDKAGKNVTCDMLEAEIHTWRERVRRRWGDEELENCTSVSVDWADLLQIPGGHRDEAEHLRVRNILRCLKTIAVRNNIALWTATQGTKEADGKEVLHMRHVSYGYHKNDSLDIGVGLGLPANQQNIENTQGQRTQAGQSVDITDNGRDVNFNINKSRNAKTGLVQLYQAPTLRFYDNRGAYSLHNDMLSRAITPDDIWRAGAATLLTKKQ